MIQISFTDDYIHIPAHAAEDHRERVVGSETQSIIMDNSFDKDSLAVEIDSSSLL